MTNRCVAAICRVALRVHDELQGREVTCSMGQRSRDSGQRERGTPVPRALEPGALFRFQVTERGVVLHWLLEQPEYANLMVPAAVVADHAVLAFAEVLAGRKRSPPSIQQRFADRRLHDTVLALFSAAKVRFGDRWRDQTPAVALRQIYMAMAREIAAATYGTSGELCGSEVAEWLAGRLPGRSGRRLRAEGTARSMVVAWEQRRRGEPVLFNQAACEAVRQRLLLDEQVVISLKFQVVR